jgi:phosphoglycolate phosphatase-like HAD superfamily hydrolase
MTGFVTHPASITFFCDFDGPLVDVSDRYYSTYRLGLKSMTVQPGQQLRLQPLSKQQFWQMKRERVCDREIAMRSGLRGKQVDQFLDHVQGIVNQPTLLHKDKMQSGVNWALALLHSKGVKLVLVTLRETNQVKQILRNYGLLRLFSAIYGTHDQLSAYHNYGAIKAHLLETAVAIHRQDQAYMVGDTEADILAAQALNIPTIALTCGIRSRTYLQQFQPDYIYNDLLCAAHHVLNLAQAQTPVGCVQ